MPNWKKDCIKDLYIVLETDGNNIRTTKRQYFTTQNPSIQQIWFYHIKHKNIELLQEMLDQKIVDIDQRCSDDGETIVHRAIQNRSKKLIDFCIKNNANFYTKSFVEEETAFYESSHHYVSTSLFIKVWSLIEKSLAYMELLKPNCTGKPLIEKLCCDDKNLEKLIWLEKEFPEAWQRLKDDNKQWDKLLYLAREEEANNVFLFLKGLQKLKNNLEKELSNKTENKKRLKI